MKNSFGFGSDGIASYFINIALPVISQPLCDIFNFSIYTGMFPDSWKTARVAHVFKNGERDGRSNYRPISVLLVSCFISVLSTAMIGLTIDPSLFFLFRPDFLKS